MAARLASLVVASAVFAAPVASACGYHSPQTVALGMLNWSFPKALYVRTAVWTAENSGMLPPRDLQRPKDMFALQKASVELRAFAGRLSAGTAGAGERLSLAVVLIDAMLWTRLQATPDGYVVHVHADGPQPDDIVVVTDAKVIRALVDGSLDAAKAETNGLFRLYRRPERHDRVRGILRNASIAKQPVNETRDKAAVRDVRR
jgi:hypothetical protein